MYPVNSQFRTFKELEIIYTTSIWSW